MTCDPRVDTATRGHELEGGHWLGLWRRRSGRQVPLPFADEAYWALPAAEILARLETGTAGLSEAAAAERLRRHGRNQLQAHGPRTRWSLLWSQVGNPLLLLLVFAVVVSLIAGEYTDAAIVLTIVVVSIAIGYRRERAAETALDALRRRISTQAMVRRGGESRRLAVEELVPGDVVLLAAGSLVPADCVLLTATDCFVSEAVLTGESFPVLKQAQPASPAAPLAARRNVVFLGTNVRSGTASCVVVRTGAGTEFGSIARRLALRPPETDFDRGIRHFGYLLTSTMLAMVLVVFVVHVLGGRPPAETLLFAIALAVGLSPELLPAILSINLARGAERMAGHGVLVRRLNAIENLGSMDVLCTDKTGTLTEGVVELAGSFDSTGETSDAVLELAAINAALETGLYHPLDEAIVAARQPALGAIEKLGEIPFDFQRKRVSVVIRSEAGCRLIAKGAFEPVLDACTVLADGRAFDESARAGLRQLFEQWSSAGVRVLAVATRELPEGSGIDRQQEHDLTFEGFVTFLDRPKAGVAQSLAGLRDLGVMVKVITGDARLVAENVARLVSLSVERVLTGAQLDELNDEALWREAERTDLFVEVDPNQKERIILALRKMGHCVGFLGDGVNDAPAMHAADTSLSVEHAVDVAREAADFVLLEADLAVIRRGVEEGRKTFANTLKYILTTTSANLGNMVSMAAMSLSLPYLPLTAGQILLNNFLSDIPAVGIAGDSVDPELIDRPRRWDLRFVGRFMIEFGILSSLFDFLTFAVLLGGFAAGEAEFRTGWFVESLLTELVIALVVRTRRPFFRSRPGGLLLTSTLVLIGLTLSISYLPGAGWLGFVPLPGAFLAALVTITAGYVTAAELTKRWFYR